MSAADISRKTVVFQVFDWEKISKNEGIGEAQVPLWQLNLAQQTDEWKALHKVTGTKDKVGSLQTALTTALGCPVQPALQHSGRSSLSQSRPDLSSSLPARPSRRSSSRHQTGTLTVRPHTWLPMLLTAPQQRG